MKLFTCLLIISLPFLTMAQGDSSDLRSQASPVLGIKWTTGLSWEQIKQKAKTENKYIFLDVFATWCGPCRLMDDQTYTDLTVLKYFNEKFISVRVQMDKTKNDNKQVQDWYEYTTAIAKEYHIYAYPTLVFLSPAGILVEQQTGFRDAKGLVSIAENAIKPGKNYLYQDYDKLMAAYNRGEKNFEKYPYMIKVADKIRDTIAKQLKKELIAHMLTLDPRERYTKENVRVWEGPVYRSNSSIYKFYFNDGHLIDKVMGEDGYSKKRIDETIQLEIVQPFFKEQNKNEKIKMSGMMVMGGPIQPQDLSEANWKELGTSIQKKYNRDYSKRNVVIARIEWYKRHNNYRLAMRFGLVRIKKYLTRPDVEIEAAIANQLSWMVFLKCTDKKILKKYESRFKKFIGNFQDRSSWVDTYANLLYKMGRINEAIKWEQKAANISPIKFSEIVEKMKKREPTYLDATWKGMDQISWDGVSFNKGFYVYDEGGKPLSGVLVVNIRTGESKTSDQKFGFASVNVIDGDIVKFSCPGYIESKVTIDKDANPCTIGLKSF